MQVVALLGFRGDDLGAGGLMHDGGDVDRRVDFSSSFCLLLICSAASLTVSPAFSAFFSCLVGLSPLSVFLSCLLSSIF